MKTILEALPYQLNSLAPSISEKTLEFHYGKHLQTYVNNVNSLSAGTPFENETIKNIIATAPEGALLNNASQVFNHHFYFAGLTPKPSHAVATGALAESINKSFGTFDEMKRLMSEASISLFGSGWVWLSADENKHLSITKYANAGNPIKEGKTPLLCIDVWEHAYYLDYQNRRADYVAALWDIVNWEVAETHFI
ncbi:MAG: superoxide dismutase [Bacteroidaceae bacterium]